MTTPIPYLPAPHTWAANEIVRAPVLRADVDGTIQLLSRPPLFIGAQTVTPQTIPSSTVTSLTMDTEFIDTIGGHQVGTTPARYWGIFAGWYLCEMTVTLNSGAAGTGVLGGMIGGVQNGGAATQYGGAKVAINNARVYQSVAAKLMLMQQVGTFNGGSNDWISAFVQQINAGAASEPTSIATAVYPRLSCRWVSAISGTEPLPVPANPAWPSPPTLLGHTFMNTNVRDAINFLIYPPIMEATNNGVGTLASSATLPATGTTVVMGTSVVDNYGAYNTTTGTWTAPVSGSYYCYAAVAISAGGNSVCMGAGLTVTSSNYNSGTQITLWGGTQQTIASNASAAVVRRRLRLNAGDTVLAAATQHDSTAAAAAYGSGTFSPRLIIVWTGA